MKKHLYSDDFKSWLPQDMSELFAMNKHTDDDDANSRVVSKVSRRKLLERIETEDDADAVIEEFLENGGILIGNESKKVYIEVECGEFCIPRFCVQIV